MVYVDSVFEDTHASSSSPWPASYDCHLSNRTWMIKKLTEKQNDSNRQQNLLPISVTLAKKLCGDENPSHETMNMQINSYHGINFI